MQTRRLGHSSVQVSRIGFGCGPTARLMVEGDDARQLAAVRRALELGIDYFDTAPVYGAGESERALGVALARLGARPVVATKVALEWDDLADIPGAVRRSVDGSLSRLGLDRVDVIHIHNRVGESRAPQAEYGSGALLALDDMLGENGVIETLQTYQKVGQLTAIGGCAYGGDPSCVRRMIDDGRLQSLLVSYSLLNPSAWTGGDPERDFGHVGAYAASRGLGVIALRALEAGRLTRIPAQPDPADPLDGLRFLGQGAEAIGGAIRYALANEEATSLLVGFSDVSQIEHAAACEAQGGLDDMTMVRIARWQAARG